MKGLPCQRPLLVLMDDKIDFLISLPIAEVSISNFWCLVVEVWVKILLFLRCHRRTISECVFFKNLGKMLLIYNVSMVPSLFVLE